MELPIRHQQVGTRYDAPTAAVPVLDQRPDDPAIVIVTHSPDIVGRYSSYRLEPVARRDGVGAGYDAPTAAVPVLGERLKRVGVDGVVVVTDGPDIVSR